MEEKKVIFEISVMSVVKVVALLFAFYVLYLVRDIVYLLIVVLIISTALEPLVARLATQKIPRALSIIVIYLFILIILSFLLYLIIPPMALQLKELALNVPYYSKRLSDFTQNAGIQSLQNVLSQLSLTLSSYGGDAIGAVFSIFGGIFSAVTIFVLTFYFLVEENGVRHFLFNLVPVAKQERVAKIIKKVGIKFSHWIRGQLGLMLLMGIIDGILFYILGVPFALTLGVLAGLLEIIPIVGPILSGIVAVIIAFIAGIAFWKILLLVGLLILVQQLENQILVPKIMQKAVGLSPVVVIIALLIGGKLFGIGGAILAVPLAAGIQVVYQEYTEIK